MKQMLPDRRDCRINWAADFTTMQLPIHVDFIAPEVLIQFLARLPHDDDRFPKADMTDVVHICNRFAVKLYVAYGDKEVCFRVNAYRPDLPGYSRAAVELEFTGIPE